jgi:hypothetical protein
VEYVPTDEDVIYFVLFTIFDEFGEYFSILVVSRKRPNVDVGGMGYSQCHVFLVIED